MYRETVCVYLYVNIYTVCGSKNLFSIDKSPLSSLKTNMGNTTSKATLSHPQTISQCLDENGVIREDLYYLYKRNKLRRKRQDEFYESISEDNVSIGY